MLMFDTLDTLAYFFIPILRLSLVTIVNAITFRAIVTMENFALVLNTVNVNAENALATHNGIAQVILKLKKMKKGREV